MTDFTKQLRVTADEEHGVGYVYFTDIPRGGVGRSIEVKIAADGIFGSLIVDVGHDGRVLGIEVLGDILPEGFFGHDHVRRDRN